MNRFVTVSLLVSAAAFAQAPRQSSDEQTLLKLEDGWAAGLVKRDGPLFRRILAPGFVYTEDDQMQTREQVLQGILSGADTVTAAHNEGMQTHMFGGTGIVTGWLIVTGRNNGPATTKRYRFTDTWVKRGNEWQIVAAQDYVAPARR